MFQGLKQLRYPAEFRISPTDWSTPGLLEAWASVAKVVGGQLPSQPLFAKGSGPTSGVLNEQLAELATGIWRLRHRLVDRGDRPQDEMSRVTRDIGMLWDVLLRAGIEIQDYSRSPYDPGLSLKVIAFQPTPGLEQEMVLETIKPCIYFNGERIQMGEVVVGTP